jgi:1-acyl-sn-glycerol-3-phosphate acyltransferase
MLLPVFWPERLFIKPIIYALLVKEVRGKYNLNKDTPYIIAPNHNSHIDEFVVLPPILSRTRRVTHFFADRKHWFQGKIYFRVIATRFRAIPVDRGKGKGDIALKRGLEKIKKGHNLIIYPEGTRGYGFELGKGKVGVAKLALWSKVPVVPVGIWGTHLLMPKGKHNPRIKKLVKINIGEPMTFREFHGMEDDPSVLREVTDRIMDRIAFLVGQEYEADPDSEDLAG